MRRKSKERNFFCLVVSENVKIALKTRPSLDGQSSKDKLYILCNQSECQYVDKNDPPCPLTLDLFLDEIEESENRWKPGGEKEYY